MEKKEECVLVKELLPIYCDDAVSEEGKDIIERHLENCKDCSTYKEELLILKEEEKESGQKLEEIQTEHATEVSKKLRRRRQRIDFISTAVIIAVWLGFLCCFQVVEVSGISMEPSFEDGERLLMNRIVYHVSDPKRGDVVSISLEDMTLLKRIVGVPGDTVEIRDNAVYINEEAVDIDGEEGMITPGEQKYPITLGKDEYFVMGDNVEVSLDSRSQEVGVIKRDEIRNRFTCKFFRFGK